MATINAIGNSSYTLTVDGGSIIATGATVNPDYSITRSSNDTAGPTYNFYKDRAGAVIVSGDALGSYNFVGRSTTTNATGAQFASVYTAGTIAAGKIPAGIKFATMSDSVGTLASRMVINITGSITIPSCLSGDALAVDGDIEATKSITSTTDTRGRTLFATGDEGAGVASQTALTNVTNEDPNSTGVLTVKSKSANPLDSTGFIKLWIGTTEYYVPIFSSTSP